MGYKKKVEAVKSHWVVRLPQFLGNLLIDGGEVVKIPGTHSVRG
jgi:hypothetical protein